MYQIKYPHWSEVYFAAVVGPLMVQYYHATAKVEGWCHLCDRWSSFEWTETEAKQAVQHHLFQYHSPLPKPESNDKLPPPGRR
jgi:hypothetical protein